MIEDLRVLDGYGRKEKNPDSHIKIRLYNVMFKNGTYTRIKSNAACLDAIFMNQDDERSMIFRGFEVSDPDLRTNVLINLEEVDCIQEIPDE